MEFIDKLILPLSLANLQLLSMLFILGKIIFFGYAGVLLVGTHISLFKRNSNSKINYGKEFIDLAIHNRIIPLSLGLLPLFAIILICLIALNQLNIEMKTQLISVFAIYTLAVILTLFYKNSYKNSNESTGIGSTLGYFGGSLQFIAIVMFSAIVSGMEISDYYVKQYSIAEVIFSSNSIIDLLVYICFSISITYAAFIYRMKSQNNENYDELNKMSRNSMISIILVFVLFNINFVFVNTKGYSTTSFVFGLLAIAGMMLQIFLLYVNSSNFKFEKSLLSFSNAIVIFALINISNYSFFAFASDRQLTKLSTKYDKVVAAHLAAKGGNKIDGKEIYQAKCMACHKFDTKLVGPPHKEVMKKYAGKMEDMVQFILKPRKVDPAYPDMPQQGLTLPEAKAVVEYMYKEYGEKLK